jgi:cell division septum initiation protein DivIVA
MTPVLVQAIKEQQQQIDELKNELAELQTIKHQLAELTKKHDRPSSKQ